MFARERARGVGILAAQLADLTFGDPAHGHPVAGFGWCAAALEKLTYRDSRSAGAVHTGVLLAGLAVAGTMVQRGTRGPALAAATAAATWASLGGTTLGRTGDKLADLLTAGDIDGARALLPSLCGRDPSALDTDGLARAALESVAENTSDAHVAPLLWAATGGIPGVLLYRGVNTLDAMIGHRSLRYARFGWAAARLDDGANFAAARVAGALVVVCAPLIGGSPTGALRAWRRDAARHPSPNAGVVEATFAGALGVRLGGPTQYHHQLEIRPTLGDGHIPGIEDLRRSVRLSQIVQVAAAVLAVGLTAVGRSGRRACPRR
ncbi:cobalamin biosynthesis protein [Mycolicibacterium sp. P1-5]|uniref:cobalamin biosynthesis protein n=1 Tax=Mycolicibacterium sp. P1-5 TaxID=2024617 RepID=UPI0011EDEE93|nr:cobalamin biosynthesis protein [Mycolicibacterium sp. P1-5]KAA0108178.1 cobalamin biosynthesis protein [Mycolicibacterium sp. P1-5]